MRCRNYSIKECTRFRTKLVAGKIIPALATTTAMICGFAMIEAFKAINGLKFESFRNTFSSLSINMHLLSEPMPKCKFKPTDLDIRFGCPSKPVIEGSTKWDQIIMEGPKTLREMTEYFTAKYDFDDVEYTVFCSMSMFNASQLSEQELNTNFYK